MRKRSIRGWKNTIFSLVLALAIILEPPMLSLAANDQTVTEKSATEESKTEEGSESEEKEEETEEEEISEDENGETADRKTVLADLNNSTLLSDTSTDADFVITGDVLKSYAGTAKNVIIPDGVTEISRDVFKDNTTIESVTCPNSLRSIGESAFNGCTGLKKVTLNEGLESIGAYAFQKAGFGGKTSTQAIEYGTLTIPSTVYSIGAYAFSGCTYLEEVKFENGETAEISYVCSTTGWQNMFAECKSLKKATLPDRATQIPRGAFSECTALEEVALGAKVETIEQDAFKSCSALGEVECPNSLRSIGESAFNGCTGLKKVTLNEGLESIGAYAFQKAGFGVKTSTQAIEYGTLTIPSTVNSIGAYAFSECTYLEEVKFENGANEKISYEPSNVVWQNMFSQCKSLKKVTLPDRATQIPSCAFSDCTALEEVTLGAKVETIEQSAFKNCSALKKVECPASLRSIEESAFQGCTDLVEVKLNEGLESIGESAFQYAGFGVKTSTQAIEYGTLTIPSTVNSIGGYAFSECAYLEEVKFVNGATEKISYEPSKVGWQNMFAECRSLKKVTLPDRATQIPRCAFSDCTALEEVTLGAKVETIEQSAFTNCSALKKVECPNSLRSIKESAFRGCTGLMDVKLNEGLESIGQYAFERVGFGGKTGSQTTVYGTLTIPSTVYSIGAYAFSECEYLEEVFFLNGETVSMTFNTGTFQNCKNLKKVYLPERLKELPIYTFYNCTSLNTLYIPKRVESINKDAVARCDFKKLVIYGEPQSAAETFAKQIGVRFNNRTELGIYAKSIKLNRGTISFAGEEAKGRQVALQATVLPSTALNKSVKYTSNDEVVATVDENGVVTIQDYGETDIVVSSQENENITASCHVKILQEWTEAELDEIRSYIEANNDLTLLSNVYPDIRELVITAPDGIKAEWKTAYEVETGANQYDVCLSKDGYQSTILKDVTVTGITVTGIKVEGPSIAQKGKNYPASVKLITAGGSLDRNDYQIEWRSANTANVTVAASAENPLEATVTGNKSSKNTNVTVRVVLNRDGKAVSVNKADLGKTWFERSFKVTVSDSAVVNAIMVSATQNQNPVALEELKELVNLTDKVTYELTASAYDSGEMVSGAALTWKSSNTSVAKVATDKSGKVTLTVMGKGSSVITVTAAKNGGYSTSFKVTVKDSTPRLAEKTVTLNRYQTDAVGYITLVPSDGCAINEESLDVVDAKSGSPSSFEIEHVEGNTYAVGIKADKSVNKGTYSVNILAKTSANEETEHKLPLKISVVQTAPKVTIRQSAINLYEEEGRGVVRIVTDAEISSIKYLPSAGVGNVRLVDADETDTEEGILYVKSENAQSNNYTKAANKGTIEIKFEGYKEEASYKKTITLAVNKKLPTITATPGSATLYPESLADTTEITLYNKTGDEEVLARNGYNVSVTSLNNYKYTAESDSFPVIQAQKGARSGALTYTVTNDNWIEGVKATAKCSLKIGKVPALSFATGTVTLNAAYTTDVYEPVSVAAYVKGFENIVFDENSTRFTGKDAKSEAALNDGGLQLYLKDGAIKAGITDSSYFTKAGSYTYIVTAYSADNHMPVTGTLKVSVVLAKSTASVSYKTTGSINLLDRENTSVIAVPKLKNYTGTVEEVELYGVNAGKFAAEVVDGNVVIKARSGKALKANGAYPLGIYATLDSGVDLKAQITVKPKQSNPKLIQSTKSIVLFESAKGIVHGDEITINIADKQAGEIKNIGLASDSDTFGYQAGADGKGIIYVKDSASLIPGKNYTLKLAVTFEDAASNAKPVYVSVKVNYCK